MSSMSIPDTFPNEIWWHIGSFSSVSALIPLSLTCKTLFAQFLLKIEKSIEHEQRRMGMPFALPLTYQRVHLTEHDVLSVWRNLSPQECRVIRTNLMNQPLVFYVSLNPLTVALDFLSVDYMDPPAFGSPEYDAYILSPANRHARGNYLNHLIVSNVLPWETALEVVRRSEEQPHFKDMPLSYIAMVARKAGVPVKKFLEIVTSIKSEFWRGRAFMRYNNCLIMRDDLPAILSIIRSCSDERVQADLLKIIAYEANIPLEDLKEMCKKELPRQ